LKLKFLFLILQKCFAVGVSLNTEGNGYGYTRKTA
jgi:hypothetical protein